MTEIMQARFTNILRGIHLTQPTPRCSVGIQWRTILARSRSLRRGFQRKRLLGNIWCMRWPDGFRCPKCGGMKASVVRESLFQCTRCRRQASVTAGTVFQDIRKPLIMWFRAIVVCDQPEKRGECVGDPTGAGVGELPNGLDMAAQVARPWSDRAATNCRDGWKWTRPISAVWKKARREGAASTRR